MYPGYVKPNTPTPPPKKIDPETEGPSFSEMRQAVEAAKNATEEQKPEAVVE